MNLKKWQIIVIIFCLILGTFLHFTYELSNFNPVIGLFSAVNESVWEHLKLLVFPMTLMSIVGIFVVKKQSKNYWVSQVLGIITAMLFVVIFFYGDICREIKRIKNRERSFAERTCQTNRTFAYCNKSLGAL